MSDIPEELTTLESYFGATELYTKHISFDLPPHWIDLNAKDLEFIAEAATGLANYLRRQAP